MIHCTGCGVQISNQAKACPKCGKPGPGDVSRRKVGVALGIGVFFLPMIFAWFLLRKGYSNLSRVLGFGWLVLGIIFASAGGHGAKKIDQAYAPGTSHVAEQATPAEVAEKLESYTASQIAKAYNDNTVAADHQFKGKRFKITGTVSDISTDIMGSAYVTMRGGVNEFMEPHLVLDDSYKGYAAGLKKGDKITLVCLGRGDIVKSPMLKECSPEH